MGDHLVERVDDRRGVECSEHASDRPREPDLGEQRYAASGVTGNRRPVAKDQPPALVPRLFGHVCEQAARLFICERKERQLFVSVESGDDTRRPSAELSGAGVEQNRARQGRDWHIVGMRVSTHPQKRTSSTFSGASATTARDCLNEATKRASASTVSAPGITSRREREKIPLTGARTGP
jgi:hypothetical protein